MAHTNISHARGTLFRKVYQSIAFFEVSSNLDEVNLLASFSREIVIDAPVDEVWKVLADIGIVHEWSPNIASSNVTTDKSTNLGARRHCNLDGGNYLDEEVVEWDVNKRLTMRIIGTDLPIKTADFRFTLNAKNGVTVVTISPEYRLKFGFGGMILDLLMVRRTYVKNMNALLNGLKHYIEKKK